MRAARPLVTAQARGAWNRALAESGLAGPVASAAALGVVALVLLVPAGITFGAGRDLGRDLTGADPAEALLLLCSLQALFTVGFAVAGGFRHRLAFDRRELGAYPIGDTSFLLAEIPAGAFEVFPLLGLTGILASNLGLASVRPAASPLILVLALQGALSLLLVQHLAGAVKRLARKRPWPALAVAAVLAAVGWCWLRASGDDPRPALQGAFLAAIPWLPGSIGYAGLVDVLAGRLATGAGRFMLMLAATGLLFGAVAWLHGREWRAEAAPLFGRRGEPATLRFRRPAVGIARLHQRLVLGTAQGWTLLVIPTVMTLSLVVALTGLRSLAGRGETMPEALLDAFARLEGMPLLEVTVFLALWVTADLWTNHFGWDGRGLQAQLALPITVRELLLGKLLGVLRLLAFAVALATTPLLAVYRPRPAEVVSAVAGVVGAAVVVATAGLAFAIRFPRAQSRTRSRATPLWLGWVPGAAMVAVVTVVVLVHRVCAAAGEWAAPAALALLAALAAAGARRAMPVLEGVFDANRERLFGR